MERRKAIALATAVTCVLGSTTVAFASVGGGSLLGFGGAQDAGIGSVSAAQLAAGNAPNVVRRTKNVYDEVVVGGSEQSSTRTAVLSGTRTAASPPANDTPPASVVTPDTDATRRRRDTSDAVGEIRRTPTRAPSVTRDPPEREPEPTTTTTSTTTSTTRPPVTTTTRPPGVPDDWPPDKPIPPMPPNCHQAQLEDNGVWNCQDD